MLTFYSFLIFFFQLCIKMYNSKFIGFWLTNKILLICSFDIYKFTKITGGHGHCWPQQQSSPAYHPFSFQYYFFFSFWRTFQCVGNTAYGKASAIMQLVEFFFFKFSINYILILGIPNSVSGSEKSLMVLKVQ